MLHHLPTFELQWSMGKPLTVISHSAVYTPTLSSKCALENGRLFEELNDKQAQESHHCDSAIENLGSSSERAELFILCIRVVA